jgi:hypothetical protein
MQRRIEIEHSGRDFAQATLKPQLEIAGTDIYDRQKVLTLLLLGTPLPMFHDRAWLKNPRPKYWRNY